jgi:hypothetical protein
MIRIVNTKPRRLKRTIIHVLEVVAHAWGPIIKDIDL